MKKFLIFLLLLSIFSFSFADKSTENNKKWLKNCKYASEIKECLENQDKANEIDDFVCIQSWTGEVIYQIILDQEFKKIDSEIEDYLLTLEQNKSYYFWPEAQEPFTNGVNEIEHYLWVGWVFEKKYKEVCDTIILKEAEECFYDWIPNENARELLKDENENNTCFLLYKMSLYNYRQTAYILMKENKEQSLKDEHKKFTQTQRKSFDNLLDLIMVNIWYLDRLTAKWRSKTN